MKLLPVEKLALEVGGWGVLALLAFFFHEVGFAVVMYFLLDRFTMFMFVHENTKDVKYDDESNSATINPYLPGMGTDWERSVRTNLPESNG